MYFEKSADFGKALAETYLDALKFICQARDALLNLGMYSQRYIIRGKGGSTYHKQLCANP